MDKTATNSVTPTKDAANYHGKAFIERASNGVYALWADDDSTMLAECGDDAELRSWAKSKGIAVMNSAVYNGDDRLAGEYDKAMAEIGYLLDRMTAVGAEPYDSLRPLGVAIDKAGQLVSKGSSAVRSMWAKASSNLKEIARNYPYSGDVSKAKRDVRALREEYVFANSVVSTNSVVQKALNASAGGDSSVEPEVAKAVKKVLLTSLRALETEFSATSEILHGPTASATAKLVKPEAFSFLVDYFSPTNLNTIRAIKRSLV